MGKKISVVVNTLNEEKNIERALRSVAWADEIVVCDMHSEDRTLEIAKKLGVKIITHERLSFVEPARNFAVSKALGDWVLVIDPDEEIPETLSVKLQEITQDESGFSFVRLPRKNIIFNKWMRASFWWPDYNIRFFKKGTVSWSNKIHIQPEVKGGGKDLPVEEDLAIIHHHYTSISQFVRRMDRYSTVQADELFNEGIKFVWTNLISKPLDEFLSRYFAKHGFEDGLHGLALSLLQAFSFLLVYLKLWEKEKFIEKDISLSEVQEEAKKAGIDLSYWFQFVQLSKNPIKKIFQKISNRI